ncbi:OmpA family protein [Acidimangrovimonas pyrenivorans]|uniref:OmpA family protein n=1 Tax=Acidimangrovimonas pyrenivorans TaxID=2030798 RepID=A0ABV7AB65_9RHOB
MKRQIRTLVTGFGLVGLAACSTAPVGSSLDEGGYGNPTMNNIMVQTGQKPYAIQLAKRFAEEVPNTVNFAFDKAYLDEQAKAVLRQQANWIRQFPEARFRVFGYTDLVGTERYNKSLGMRRARTVVNYLVSQGISRSRLQAVVSYGETRPLIPTPNRERRNRRAVTEVSGFVKTAPLVLNGKYAQVIFREYVKSAVPTDGVEAAAASSSTSTTPTGN